MKELNSLNEFWEAVENGKTVYDINGYKWEIPPFGTIAYFWDMIKTKGLYVVNPEPESERYVYRRLDWDSLQGLYPKVEIQNTYDDPVARLALIGTGHWENGREYRLAGFTKTINDKEEGGKFVYYESQGKMTYARFVLQPKETD